MSSKINVKEIFDKHHQTIQYPNKSLSKKDKQQFFLYPIIGSIIALITIGKPNSDMINIFAVCLSIFIGLFLNLLVLILSFTESKTKIKDKKNRAELLEQTFYNLSYTIVISLIALGILFLTTISIFPSNWNLQIPFSRLGIDFNDYFLNVNYLITNIIAITFYFVFIKVIVTLLMIVKRIFNLFIEEIKSTNEENKIDIKDYEDYD
ncbi:hypothetical protein [Labilibaculum euxinus]|uniref:Uncharacterized protein n=1 Tax=Labilibaculum euxinus TaxID=2686357 RepID=A0A7M4D7P5_9BACT|nr:hypothetical protein [Labilibaculum euxinus]MUP38674.1 hypothetical protein [Labilibaculum euxinus]MVB07879.1 hypothetical protein [Labilibaculum euxinus]